MTAIELKLVRKCCEVVKLRRALALAVAEGDVLGALLEQEKARDR